MLQVALIYPEIPPNTGNIARTCAATNTPLHLVEPLGFEINDRQLKRAGIDYWEYVNVTVHPNIASLREASKGGRWICFSAHATHNFHEFEYQDGDWLLFGSESKGLPKELIANNPAVYIPMEHPKVRSLNLSVSAALGLFEARRQLGM